MVGRSFSAGERAARAASPRSFRRGMRQAGIDDLDTVLSYDDVGGVNCRSAGYGCPWCRAVAAAPQSAIR